MHHNGLLVNNERLLLFTDGGGRLANQLLNFSHLIAWMLEHPSSGKLVNLAFIPYGSFFVGTSAHPFCHYPTSNHHPQNVTSPGRLMRRVVRRFLANDVNRIRSVKLLRYLLTSLFGVPSHELYTRDPYNLSQLCSDDEFWSQRVILLSGWGPREWSTLEKHAMEVRNFLRPIDAFLRPALEYTSQIRNQHEYEILIGVLIRQTDYRTWNDGRYFFEYSTYATWMKAIAQHFAPSRVGFVIASDEYQPNENSDSIETHFATGSINHGGHYMESLVQLSLCDFILTPPSTFSGWAAFMGDIPLIPLTSETPVISFLSNHLFDARHHPDFSVAVN